MKSAGIFSDFRIRYAREPGWQLDSAHAITVADDGTLAFTKPYYPGAFDEAEPLPQTMRDDMIANTTTARISLLKVRNLVKAFVAADFLNLDFLVREDWLDAGWQELTFRHGGREQTVGYDGTEQPPEFRRLRDRLLRLAREVGMRME